jgi:hypothetical protein
MTTTDQIQSRLYAKSDNATKRAVEEAVTPLRLFLAKKQATQHTVKLPVSFHVLRMHDGVKFTQGMSSDDLANQILSCPESLRPYLQINASDLVHALAKTLAVTLQSEDRKAFVEAFLNEVESLRTKVDELEDRLGAVE